MIRTISSNVQMLTGKTRKPAKTIKMVENKPVAPARAPATTLAGLWQQRLLHVLEQGIADLGDRKLPAARRVQRARQATKAARALLRLAPIGLRRQARGLSMALAGARRQLGGIRDRDAMAGALETVAAKVQLPARQLNLLIKPLKSNMITRSLAQPHEVTSAAETLRRVLAQLQLWKVPRGRSASLLQAIKEDHRRLRRDARPGLALLDVEDLHDLRKRAITHRHQMALLADFMGSRGKKYRRRMEKAHTLHEAIGNHRDLYLLQEYLRTLPDHKTYSVRQIVLAIIENTMKKQLDKAIALERWLDSATPGKMVRAARQRLA